MKKSKALIGYTGFIGGNIGHQHDFDFFYDASNIEEIKGKHFDLVVCAGAPGVKWLANQEPAKDMASLQRLMDALSMVEAEKCVLISTIDVYAKPHGVTEDSFILKDDATPYGKHRRILEEFVGDKYDTLIVRLPGVFGQGLKKNIIYDFMHGVHTPVHPESIFQFYSLDHIWTDITTALENQLSALNIASEPIAMAELEKEIFGPGFFPAATGLPVRYDMHTKHALLWKNKGNYLYNKQQVMQDLKAFVASQ